MSPRRGWVSGLAASRKGVALTFHKGALLDDPDGVLKGDGRYARNVAYETAKAKPGAVKKVVREAVEHQTDMLDR